MKKESVEKLQPALLHHFESVLKKNQLAHAYLFSGDFGNFELSLLLAQSLFCTEKDGVWACGKCRNCRLIEAEEFSDVTVVRPINQIIKTDRVRDLVQSFSQSGVEGNRQVFIICDADKMHTNAANSLLKTMEEPQSEIYLFLLSSDSEKILPTIRSRTQVISFPKNDSYLRRYLEEQGLLKTEADLLAAVVTGFSQAEELAKSKTFFELAAECDRFTMTYLKGAEQALLQVSKLTRLADDKVKQEQVFQILEVLFAQHMQQKSGREGLEKLVLARKMWRQNVAFQATLEYMVLS